MTKVLCIGIATLDYVYAVEEMPTSTEKKYRAYELVVTGGGTAASAAHAIAKLGGDAMLTTRLGNDPIGSDIIAELEAAGVDCKLTRRFDDCRSPCSAVFVDRSGERLVICYADERTPDDASWLPDRLPERTRAILADVSWVTGALRMFDAARIAGIPSVIDGDRVVDNPTYFDQATHVAYSAETACELAGTREPPEALAVLARRARNWIAVTHGPRGVWFAEDGTIAHEPAFLVETVDTLGAGDVFHGALALALGEGMRERAAVRFANAAAAIKCTRFGGGRRGAPNRAEVEALLRERA